MKTKAALSFLSLSLMGIVIISQAHAADSKENARAHSEAVESCVALTNKSVSDLGVWAEHQGISQQQWRQLVAVTCLNGITAARESKSEDELDTYWFEMKQKYAEANAGPLSTPIDPAWSISTKYFRALNGAKNKNVTH